MDSATNEALDEAVLRVCWSLVPVPKMCFMAKGRLAQYSLQRYARTISTSRRIEIEKQEDLRRGHWRAACERQEAEDLIRCTFIQAEAARCPIAVPPSVDWDWFSTERLRSIYGFNVSYQMIYIYQRKRRTSMVSFVLCGAVQDIEMRHQFYLDSSWEVFRDWEVVRWEWKQVKKKATALGRLEYNWLDNDGETTELEEKLKAGENMENIFRDGSVHEKNGYLLERYEDNRAFSHFKSKYIESACGIGGVQEILWLEPGFLEQFGKEVAGRYGFVKPTLMERIARAGGDGSRLRTRVYTKVVDGKILPRRSEAELGLPRYRGA